MLAEVVGSVYSLIREILQLSFITVPGCLVYICDFHREQAWVRWINNSKNGINKDKKDNLLNSLRNLARTSTEGDFNLALRDLQDSELWRTNTRLQKWMNTTWLPERQASVSLAYIIIIVELSLINYPATIQDFWLKNYTHLIMFT